MAEPIAFPVFRSNQPVETTHAFRSLDEFLAWVAGTDGPVIVHPPQEIVDPAQPFDVDGKWRLEIYLYPRE